MDLLLNIVLRDFKSFQTLGSGIRKQKAEKKIWRKDVADDCQDFPKISRNKNVKKKYA